MIMVLWDKTFELFGINSDTVKNSHQIRVACDHCGVEATRNYRVYMVTFRKRGRNLCHDCTMADPEHKKRCSVNTTAQWGDDSYRQAVSTGVSAALADAAVRDKMRTQSRQHMADPTITAKISKSVSVHMADPTVRADIADKMTTIMAHKRTRHTRLNKQERSCVVCCTSKVISDDSYRVNVQKNGGYTCHKCGIARAAAAGLYIQTTADRSRRSKELWQDQEFRANITAKSKAALSTPEAKARASAKTTALWENEEYAARVSAAITEKFESDQNYRQRCSDGLKEKWTEEDYRTRQAKANANRPHISSIQHTLYQLLTDLNVDYEPESAATVIGYYAFDCLVRIPGRRSLLIECQGDYFHTRPDSHRSDAAKFTYIDRYFPDYEIMYIWEHEFKTKDRVLDRLKLKLGIQIETKDFKFSDVIIKQIDAITTSKFLDAYHYIGKGRGGKSFGAYLGDQLVAVVVLSPPIRQGIAAKIGAPTCVELSRLCIHPSYHKYNFGSWLLAKVLKTVTIPVVAFADKTAGHLGTVYKASNFKEHHRVAPDYWYVDADGYVMHKKTLYNRATNCHLTEAAYAKKFHYRKKYGGQKICFTYNL